MRKQVRIGIYLSIVFSISPIRTELLACECGWAGPFLKVACKSPLVFQGRIRSHAQEKNGVPPSIEVEIVNIFHGISANSLVRVWGDNEMLCRVDPRRFPVGSEWLLALDGPGSKPAMTPDHALSNCGQFWLEIRQGKVIGNIDSETDQAAVQEMSIARFRERFQSKVCRDSIRFSGEIFDGKPFLQYFGPHFAFHLRPAPKGWMLSVTDERGMEDIARLTPPFHFSPNPREIEGWHFRNADNTGPNQPGEKNVNAPGQVREFIFSPEVGKTIDGPTARRKPNEEELDRIRRYGIGTLTILEFRLKDLEPGRQAGFDWMRFNVEIFWPQ